MGKKREKGGSNRGRANPGEADLGGPGADLGGPGADLGGPEGSNPGDSGALAGQKT